MVRNGRAHATAHVQVQGKGNDAIIEALSEAGTLLKREQYPHKYPYDWRTKKPTIFRATDQVCPCHFLPINCVSINTISRSFHRASSARSLLVHANSSSARRQASVIIDSDNPKVCQLTPGTY